MCHEFLKYTELLRTFSVQKVHKWCIYKDLIISRERERKKKEKNVFPDGESNPGRGGESAKS